MMQHNHCVELYGAHGDCWGWDGLLVALHTSADALVALAYFAIPVALFYLARKHRVRKLSRVFLVYGLFILLCGTTHVFDVIMVWQGGY
jgi:two-component system sensor histidine kinase/response regulator